MTLGERSFARSAAEITDQREQALQLPPWRATLGEEGLREHRHPVNERLPALGSEGDPGRRRHRHGNDTSGEEHRPLRCRDQH